MSGGFAPAEVAPGVYVVTAARYTTTTTIVTGADGGCLVIDPAVSAADLAALADWLAGRGLRPVAGWSTHPHWDHLLWSAGLGLVTRYATPRAAAVVAREREALLRTVAHEAPGHDLGLYAVVEPLGPAEIGWPGPRAVVCPHEAHAPGHGGLFLPETGVLVAGDMLSDVEIPLPNLETGDPGAADPFGDYRRGLDVLAGVPGVRVLVPGHGHVGDAAELRRRVAADQRYLDAVAAGDDYPDERLTQDWLRTEHARALALARAT